MVRILCDHAHFQISGRCVGMCTGPRIVRAYAGAFAGIHDAIVTQPGRCL